MLIPLNRNQHIDRVWISSAYYSRISHWRHQMYKSSFTFDFSSSDTRYIKLAWFMAFHKYFCHHHMSDSIMMQFPALRPGRLSGAAWWFGWMLACVRSLKHLSRAKRQPIFFAECRREIFQRVNPICCAARTISDSALPAAQEEILFALFT